MLFRTYPRVPFWEQIHDSIPFYTDSGRLASYADIPEAIEYGENLVVHREAVEATPYLPNVIVSTSPYIRPKDYGISPETIDPELRQVRNLRLSWAAVKKTVNPLWRKGTASFVRPPRADTRRTPPGPRSIGTGSGATTSVTPTAPTSGRRRSRPPDPNES